MIVDTTYSVNVPALVLDNRQLRSEIREAGEQRDSALSALQEIRRIIESACEPRTPREIAILRIIEEATGHVK